jgi:hypothetical protein
MTTNTTPKKRVPKAVDDKNFYNNPKQFKIAIAEYYSTQEFSDYLGNCINKIAQNLCYKPNFINYTYKDDMIGDAILKMWSALKRKKFDVKSDTNPHSYFTTIAWHAFINRIKKENKHASTINAFKEKAYEELITSAEGHVYIKPVDFDNDDDYNMTND